MAKPETEVLMAAPSYRRVHGALRQVRFVPEDPQAMERPAWCEGCAWATESEGGCEVFNDAWDCWLRDGRCEAWADEGRRAEIEQAVRAYEASH